MGAISTKAFWLTVFTASGGLAALAAVPAETAANASAASTVTLTATPTNITPGESATLTWTMPPSSGAYIRQTAKYNAYPGAVSASWVVTLNNVQAGSTIYVVGVWPNYVNTYPTMAVTDGKNAYTLLDRYDDRTLFNLGVQGTQSMGHWYAANVAAGSYRINMTPMPETYEDYVGVVAFEVAGLAANPLDGHTLHFQAGIAPGPNALDAVVSNSHSDGILIATTFDDVDATAPTSPLVGTGFTDALQASFWWFVGTSPAATAEYALLSSAGSHAATFSPQETGSQLPNYLTTAAIFTAAAAGSSPQASCTASGGWSGTEPSSGTYKVSPTATTTYTLQCGGAAGTPASATVSVSLATPTVSLSANPVTITLDGTSTLTWTSTSATSCTASGGWSGAEPMSGKITVSPAHTTAYTISCSGAGETAQSSTTVTVNPASTAPTATIELSPSSIVSGAASTISWASHNASECTAGGNWSFSGALPISGTEVTSQVGAAYYIVPYTITCTGPGGTASATAELSVNP